MSIKQYESQGSHYYKVYVSSKSINFRAQRRKSNIQTKGEARAWEKRLKLECIEEIKERAGEGEKWCQIVATFKQFKEEFSDLQQNTIEDYVSMMEMWTLNFWQMPISKITRKEVRNAIDTAKRAGKSNSHLTKILHTIGRIYKWAQQEGLCPRDLPCITHGIQVFKIEDKPPKILTLKQLQVLFARAEKQNNPWFPIWFVAIHTGMRSGELYALKWSKVDLEARRILVDLSYNRKLNGFKPTKNAKFRTVPINQSLYNLLLRLRGESTSEFVLPRIKRWEIGHQAKAVQEICSELGLPMVNFHTFRSCFATHLLSLGVSLAHVMKICGWAELKTTQRYLRLAGIEEKGITNCLDELMVESLPDKFLKLRLCDDPISTFVYSDP